MFIVKCKWCNIEFAQKREGHIFCSHQCREKDFHKRQPHATAIYTRRARLKVDVICRNCNKPIPTEQRRSGLVHCSDKCAKQTKKRNGKVYRDISQKEFSQFKLSSGCSICGYNKCAAALDFHHTDPTIKDRRVTANMWKDGLGRLELEKCILVCKNCHYELHHLEKVSS